MNDFLLHYLCCLFWVKIIIIIIVIIIIIIIILIINFSTTRHLHYIAMRNLSNEKLYYTKCYIQNRTVMTVNNTLLTEIACLHGNCIDELNLNLQFTF